MPNISKPSYRVPRKQVVLPKDRGHGFLPPYIGNEQEFMRLAFSIKAADALVRMLVENYYPNDRKKMLAAIRNHMARLRFNIDRFLKTYYEKDKL
jgi:hypothetical protein